MEFSVAHEGMKNNLLADIDSYYVSGDSCSTCCAEMDFTENNGHCFQATTKFTALRRVTRHLPQQPPIRNGIGRWRGSVLSAALLD